MFKTISMGDENQRDVNSNRIHATPVTFPMRDLSLMPS